MGHHVSPVSGASVPQPPGKSSKFHICKFKRGPGPVRCEEGCSSSKPETWVLPTAGHGSAVSRTLGFVVRVPVAVCQLAARTEAFLGGFSDRRGLCGPGWSGGGKRRWGRRGDGETGPCPSVWGGFDRLGKRDQKLSPGGHSWARVVFDLLSPQGAEGQVVGVSLLRGVCPSSPCRWETRSTSGRRHGASR